MNPLLSATDLVQWADRRESQAMLPMLVRRLILATVDPIKIDFVCGDSVNRPGYDGILQTADGDLLVPAGQSVWEMGVDKKPSVKANGDYGLRQSDPDPVNPAETTFVFITPRRWQGKAKWAAQRRQEKFWHDVHAYDADDLEQWLDRSPAVAVWARSQIVGLPEGLRDLEQVWESWSLRTKPPLVPEVFTNGRTAAVQSVRNWFEAPPSLIRIQADTVDEAVGFFAAVIKQLHGGQQDRVLSRAIFVTSADALHSVTSQSRPCFVITTTHCGPDFRAVQRGHHMAICYGNDAAGLNVEIPLPPSRRPDLEAALQLMNLPDERCRSLANESRGRLAALVELLGHALQPPHWAYPAIASDILPFFLAGKWNESPADLEALATLAGASADEISFRLSRWANEPDPPIRLVAGKWEWISRKRAWPHLARHITAHNLETFRHVVIAVLGENDPGFKLPPDQRWLANLHNATPRYSHFLREGLAEMLTILGTHPNAVLSGSDVAQFVNVVVRDLFGHSPDPQRWYSLAYVLPLLAEAAPAVFIAAAKTQVLCDNAVREALFQEVGYFGGCRLNHLLWALEILAWAPEHLTEVSLLLAELTVHDTGGKTSNRPDATLRAIFLPWCPGTTASAPQRVAALEAVHARAEDVAFETCVRLLPKHGGDTAFPTQRPKWNDFCGTTEIIPTVKECRDYTIEIFERAMHWAADDQERWAKLLHSSLAYDHSRYQRILDGLAHLPLKEFGSKGDGPLRRALRHLLHLSRTVPEAGPQFTPDQLSHLEKLYVQLEPSDVVLRDAWLFDQRPDLLSVVGNDWQAEQEAILRERQIFIDELVMKGNIEHVLRLAALVEDPWAVGYAGGQSRLDDANFLKLFCSCVAAGKDSATQCALGMVWGRSRRDGWNWILQIFSNPQLSGWPSSLKVSFALGLPFETRTWNWINDFGSEASNLYWQMVKPQGVVDAAQDAAGAVQLLLTHNRPITAFHLCELYGAGKSNATNIEVGLLLEVVRAFTAVIRGEKVTAEKLHFGQGFGFALTQILARIETAGACTEEEIATIEWIWLPVLIDTERGIAALSQMLARDWSLFAQVVAFTFQSTASNHSSDQAIDELARERARQGQRLLQQWKGIPGQTEDGKIDIESMMQWIISARAAFRESGHAEIGDLEIGKMLARLPTGIDGNWPHEGVRQAFDRFQSNAMERGFHLGVVNGRGPTWRAHADGGRLESELADRYSKAAETMVAFPRTATILRRIAEHYRALARHEDQQRDLNEYD